MRRSETLWEDVVQVVIVRWWTEINMTPTKKGKVYRYLASEETGWRTKGDKQIPKREWSLVKGDEGWEEAHEFQSVQEAKLFCSAINVVKELEADPQWEWTREILLLEVTHRARVQVLDPVHPLVALAECAD